MKKHFIIPIIFLVALAASQTHKAGELQFLWSNTLDSGVVFDMEFMPDNNYFIMGTYYYTQIRETATGNVVQTYPFYLSHIEFTPDSTKMITQHEYNIQLRNINDLSVIKQYTLPWGTDTTDLNYELSSIGWDNIVVDPIRPLCYGLRVRSGIISNNKRVNINRVMIYNYETMQEAGELTTQSDINLGIKIIAVSKDGKYLAAITSPESHILVWDLNTRQKIRDFKVCSYIPNVGGGEPAQLTFSQINTDNIYFSGSFPQSKNTWYDGILLYNITQNKITDSTFAVGDKMTIGPEFCLFDNEERTITHHFRKIYILNNITKQLEQQIDRDTISGGMKFWGFDRYSKSLKYFIGFGTNVFSCIKNDLETTVPIPQSKGVLYPNPAQDYIEISVGAGSKPAQINDIHIFDILGTEVLNNSQLSIFNSQLRINVSALAPGIYFVRVGDFVGRFVKY